MALVARVVAAVAVCGALTCMQGHTRGRLRAFVGLTSYSRATCVQLIALIMNTQAHFPADLPIYAYPEPCCR